MAIAVTDKEFPRGRKNLWRRVAGFHRLSCFCILSSCEGVFGGVVEKGTEKNKKYYPILLLLNYEERTMSEAGGHAPSVVSMSIVK